MQLQEDSEEMYFVLWKFSSRASLATKPAIIVKDSIHVLHFIIVSDFMNWKIAFNTLP
jgi:hypothetical protein